MIEEILKKLRQLTQVEVQSNWYYTTKDLQPTVDDLDTLIPAQINSQGYIIWDKGGKVQWLAQKFTVPQDINGYSLQGMSWRLLLTWWAEYVQIFLNGKLVQEGDLFDSSTRLLLSPNVNHDQEIFVCLRLVSPRHDSGALMASKLLYERTENNGIDPGFFADELTVLFKYLQVFAPEKLETLANYLSQINYQKINTREFEQNLLKLRQKLEPLATEIKIKQRCFHLLGHAHLDLAWLWPVEETWLVAQNTFTSVLNLQKEFPDLKFCHTSPVLYAWIEKHRPDLFKSIQEAVKKGSWEVLGGMWVEPEVNLVSGESLIRQLLYGQRYFQKKFAKTTKVAWLPDSFGFTWQLPQIFQQAEIEFFVTGKLHWNDSTKFPYGAFWWESPDGTQLLTVMSPPNVTGIMDTNPITMVNYALDWQQQTGLTDIFWLPGVGDHGGGPTRDMLKVAQRWQKSPFFPEIKFTIAEDYLSSIKEKKLNVSTLEFSSSSEQINLSSLSKETFPIWKDELYLEFHRGCYTSHADQKVYNRSCENLLYQAELWSSLASVINPTFSYPQAELESAWKLVLFNQFHDILPGTSIPEVFVTANREWQTVEDKANQIQEKALQAIASQIALPESPHPEAKPLLIFNPLNWKRSQVVSIPINGDNYTIYDQEKNIITCQYCHAQKLLFLAEDIPSIGYRLYWLSPNLREKFSDSRFVNKREIFKLENQYLRVIINHHNGNIMSIYHKKLEKDFLSEEGNRLQAYQDKGQYWDAWNIDPNYSQYPLPETKLKSIEYLELGPIQWRIRVKRILNKSEFIQDYILETDSEILKIATTVNWLETHTLVKAIFPLNLESDWVNYEIPCATISRPTYPQTEAEKAKWEVPALRWGDITDNSQTYGVSLLNNNKYGYSHQANQLNLTLLRSPIWPDANADRGIHYFTYGIYCHQGGWERAKTVHRGYELNHPLQIISNNQQIKATLAPSGQLLNLSADNLILMAFKLSEDEPKTYILRCYEAYGREAKLVINSDLSLQLGQAVNLLENPQYRENENVISPWKIVTFKLKYSGSI